MYRRFIHASLAGLCESGNATDLHIGRKRGSFIKEKRGAQRLACGNSNNA
jgi:hypothetical protein